MIGTPHKHRDVIIAWANGEEIEWMNHLGRWEKLKYPNWVEDQQYRIKPKRVKKEGWVNVYEYDNRISETKEQADKQAAPSRVACIRIEWEEEA